jgi:hypothetical protein
VIYDGAQSVETADPVARVSALVPNASPVSRTIGIQDTLRTASQVWISLILGQAGAHTVDTSRICAAIGARIRNGYCCV